MNKKLYIFFLILLGFILNIFFYIFSDNYRYFLQSLKNDNGYKINERLKVNLDDIIVDNSLENNETVFSGLQKDFFEDREKITNKNKIKKNEEYINSNSQINIENKVEYVDKRENIKLTNIEKNVLKEFKKYNLKEIELHPRLFDLTNEYPDDYFEYYNKDITLYFFGNKSYNDLKDIFEVLTYELPFSLNEANNFGQKSFYINLNALFDDGYVRIVLQKSNRTFGIKLKKEQYNKIKNDLAIIFK